MDQIIRWLSGVESRAHNAYRKSANYFEKDDQIRIFLERIAEDEVWHYHVMASAAEHVRKSNINLELSIKVDEETDARITGLFNSLEEKIASSTLTIENMLEIVAEAELSEWNDIFLYVLSELKNSYPEFSYPSFEIQRHKKAILAFFERHVEKGNEKLASLKRLPDIWTENILVVDDEPNLRDLFGSIMSREGNVDVACNGSEALDLIEKKYYKLVITDLTMPVMDGVALYKNAVEKHPGLSDRFLFITGGTTNENRDFLESINASVLLKPVSLNMLRTAALKVILKASQ